ncbi:MAG: PEP-CTERM sorting domain-containing protein [Myxococcaceae bacterium]|nr:MAG: PEP-CTERM sorting domain-containing protein [Myxococcaceae bacterium]
MRPTTILLSIFLLPQAGAVTIISDSFDSGIAVNASVNGRTPDVSLTGSKWVTNTTLISGDGGGALKVSYADTRNIALDLGANYFVNNPGVHELSLTITTPSSESSASWIGFGFTQGQGNSVSPASASVAGQPWAVYRQNGGIDVFAGPQNTNALTNGVGQPVATASKGTPHMFTLRLDTSAAEWTLQFLLDGNLMDLGTTGSQTHTFTTQPTIQYLMVSMGGGAASGTGSVDDFSLISVPEPGVTFLAGLSALTLFLRRRVRNP